MDLAGLSSWIGKRETRAERVAPFPARALAATLDRDDPPYAEGTPLPPLWHWLHFLEVSPLREAGPDGHSKRGGFLPPVPLPRRMWAGSRLAFPSALKIGAQATRTSLIKAVEHKAGRSGNLVFVTVRHEIEADGHGLVIAEEHDIVYREATPKGAATPNPPVARDDHAWQRVVHPDPVLLFRYSALTFNSHRIHYDLPYVMNEEGYPGLVVHGPLIATLLLDLLRRERPEAIVRSFSFRAVSPLIAGSRFEVRGKPEGGNAVALWAANAGGGLAMEARAEIAER